MTRWIKKYSGWLPAILLLGYLGFNQIAALAAGGVHEGFQAYDRMVFDTAVAEGDTIVLDAYASWCPTCRNQSITLTKAATSDEFEDVVFLQIDYDTQEGALQKFAIERQSTIIVMQGGEEKARMVAVTDEDKLLDAIRQGL